MTGDVETSAAEAPASASSAAVAAWGLAMGAGCRVIELFLEASSMASVVAQAVLVEWGCSRLGVGWSPAPEGADQPRTAARIARRAGLGAAIGLGAAGAVFAVLSASRGLSVRAVANVEVSVLVVGLASAAALALRDELLVHGVTLRALEGTSVGPLARVLACAVTSAGAALGRDDAAARTVFVAGLLGVVFGALWIRDRGAWQPWAANTGFHFATGTLLSGGIVHSRLADGAWAGGSAGMLGGTAATIALAPFAVAALAWTARGISPSPPKQG